MSAMDQMNDVAPDREQQHVVDYKMVTFALGGKDYGVDIMDVKEISKAERLTPVPNTAPYVRGVINLRGEITSTIDLRRMLNLPDQETILGEAEDVIFINVDDHLIGIIVDSINDVIGIDSSTIQAPHPLFGEVNLMYIEGVVEYQDKLYIILDTEAIFGAETAFTDEKTAAHSAQSEAAESTAVESIPESVEGVPAESDALSYTFITETLFTTRFDTWTEKRGLESASLQLKSHEDAEEFLTGFYSADRDVFWTEEKAKAFAGIAPVVDAPALSVWNVGCGEGREAYSAASALTARFTDKQIKIWAQDSDLIKISNAPNLVFGANDIPEWMRRFTVEGSKGMSFSPELSESIVFEYHDILNENQLPSVNIIIAKDILSFLKPKDGVGLLNDFSDKLAPGGILIVGDHERVTGPGWSEHEAPGIRWYIKTV